MKARLIRLGRTLRTVCRVAFWLLVLVACLAVLHQQRQLTALTEDVWEAISAAEQARDAAQDAYSAADEARSAAEDASSSASEAADAASSAEDAVWATH
jgi:biopolymer transport protein ExbB/TolQ